MSTLPSAATMAAVIDQAKCRRAIFVEADNSCRAALRDPEQDEPWRRAASDAVPEWDPPHVIALTHQLHQSSATLAELALERFEAWGLYISAVADKIKTLYGPHAVARPTANGCGQHVVFREAGQQ